MMRNYSNWVARDFWFAADKEKHFPFWYKFASFSDAFEMQTGNKRIRKFLKEIIFTSSPKRLIIISTCRLLPFNPVSRQTIRLPSKFTEKNSEQSLVGRRTQKFSVGVSPAASRVLKPGLRFCQGWAAYQSEFVSVIDWSFGRREKTNFRIDLNISSTFAIY